MKLGPVLYNTDYQIPFFGFVVLLIGRTDLTLKFNSLLPNALLPFFYMRHAYLNQTDYAVTGLVSLDYRSSMNGKDTVVYSGAIRTMAGMLILHT